jgi:DNA-binding transcriptional ArsR family regulator
VIAHIGNVPVEEWLPFLVPVIALYVYGRHRDRRRTGAVESLPQPAQALDAAATQRVLAEWRSAGHDGPAAEHVALFYPPGPEEMTAAQLALRLGAEAPDVQRLLDSLEELGYVELEAGPDAGQRRVWLTLSGYDLLLVTETTLLGQAAREREAH